MVFWQNFPRPKTLSIIQQPVININSGLQKLFGQWLFPKVVSNLLEIMHQTFDSTEYILELPFGQQGPRWNHQRDSSSAYHHVL